MSMIINEIDRQIYRDELAPRLPRRIFDAHVHIWDATAFPAGFKFAALDVNNRFGGTFSLDQWREAIAELLPEQEAWLNCFGSPNDAALRDYVPPVNHRNEFCNVMVSPADDVDVVRERIEKSGAVGVKPYLNFAAMHYNKPSAEVEPFDMLTRPQLEYLNAAGLAVTFHIPRPGRFADRLNQRQMIEMCEKYPNIRFIFAHVGRAYFMKNIQESNLDEFVKYPNAYFDTAMVNHEGVLKYTFDHFPADRVLFATDAPISYLRGKSVEINNQYAYLMAENYAIGTAIRDQDHVVKFTTFFYEQLRAILNTAPADAVEKVFFSNACKLFQGIRAK